MNITINIHDITPSQIAEAIASAQEALTAKAKRFYSFPCDDPNRIDNYLQPCKNALTILCSVQKGMMNENKENIYNQPLPDGLQ